jgi:acyl-CoA synthetase (AMP-forming)/AMP-acid ligase II
VVITHAAAIDNMGRSIDKAIVGCGTDRVPSYISWVPFYHDYGLFATLLLCWYRIKLEQVSFSPMHFIQNPLLWVDAMEEFDSAATNGPDFAYNLLYKRMKASNRAKLSGWLLHTNIMAEPIAVSTFHKMVEMGMPGSSITPTYGMAECCALVSLLQGDEIVVAPNGSVSVGMIDACASSGVHFRIVDPDSGRICSDGGEGRIYVSSPSLASGYWKDPEASKVFRGKYCVVPDFLREPNNGDQRFAKRQRTFPLSASDMNSLCAQCLVVSYNFY